MKLLEEIVQVQAWANHHRNNKRKTETNPEGPDTPNICQRTGGDIDNSRMTTALVELPARLRFFGMPGSDGNSSSFEGARSFGSSSAIYNQLSQLPNGPSFDFLS